MPVMVYHQGGDPYEHVLTDLRKRRDELDIAIRAIEAVRTPPTASSADSTNHVQEPQSPKSIGQFSGVSIAEASKQVLQAHGSAMSTADIVPIIQAGGVRLTSTDAANTVNSVLSRRSLSMGDIVRVGRGRIQSWNPTRTT